MRGRWARGLAATLALLGMATVGGWGTAAQEEAAHPAHVHLGTCDDLDPNPAFPLTDVAPVAGETAGADSAVPVEQSVTTLDVALDDLLAGGYAINIHESTENAARYIACGDIGGTVAQTDGGGRTLAIGLREETDSGYSGIASLADDGAGGTTVTIFLSQDLAAGAAATPAAEDAEAVTIRIVDFAFEPAQITVPVGTTVTWVNDGPTDHTATAFDDGDKIWDSNILAAGESYSYTFEEAGTFDYVCSLHPSMQATIEVVS